MSFLSLPEFLPDPPCESVRDQCVDRLLSHPECMAAMDPQGFCAVLSKAPHEHTKALQVLLRGLRANSPLAEWVMGSDAGEELAQSIVDNEEPPHPE